MFILITTLVIGNFNNGVVIRLIMITVLIMIGFFGW
jgi:hypothetical protein